MPPNGETRRRFIRIAGTSSLVGIAGCGGGGGEDGGETTTTTPPTTEGGGGGDGLPEGVSQEEFDTGPVPEAYRTATSQGGTERVPDNLVTKESVKYQAATAAVEAGLAEAGQRCENCAEYIPDKNGDGLGACAKVEGYIAPTDWCALWVSV